MRRLGIKPGQRVALELGLVDVKVAAIDDGWPGLRLVWRAGKR